MKPGSLKRSSEDVLESTARKGRFRDSLVPARISRDPPRRINREITGKQRNFPTFQMCGGHHTMPDHTHVRADVSRRQILQKILSGAIAGVVVQAGIGLAFPQKGYAQSRLSPDAALQALLAGNQRMVAN